MKNEIDINRSLRSADLLDLFRTQLAKDFDGAGFTGAIPATIPTDFLALKQLIGYVLAENSGRIAGLLYRVDISEGQIKKANEASTEDFESLVAELIIKRVLQKVILKKNYSGK